MYTYTIMMSPQVLTEEIGAENKAIRLNNAGKQAIMKGDRLPTHRSAISIHSYSYTPTLACTAPTFACTACQSIFPRIKAYLMALRLLSK